MKRTYKRVFQRNPSLIDEMMKLRLAGWSFPALGKKYGVDYSSIIYQCRRRGVPRVQIYKPKEIKKMETKLLNIEMNFTKEKVCEGKSYAEYLVAEKERKWKELLTIKKKGI